MKLLIINIKMFFLKKKLINIKKTKIKIMNKYLKMICKIDEPKIIDDYIILQNTIKDSKTLYYKLIEESENKLKTFEETHKHLILELK